MGEDAARRREEIATLRLALDCGIRVIDTAEMYGEGKAEMLTGEAIRGCRDQAFLVSKVYPHNASRHGTIEACEKSLGRLGTDHLDLYLLHWRGSIPFAETLEAFLTLQKSGMIRHFGVSNLDHMDMQEWCALTGGENCSTDQVLYNLGRRGIEYDLLPWLESRKIPLMAYSPIEQARLLRHPDLVRAADALGISPLHAALGWMLNKDNVISIPKTGNPEHLKDFLRIVEHPLTPEQIATLDRIFPAPQHQTPLQML